jgi:hypothetical protein
LRADAERALTSAREMAPANARIAAIEQKIAALPAPPAGG